MDRSQKVRLALLLIAVGTVAYFIGRFAWNEYQDARCERILMETENRDGEEAVRCFQRFADDNFSPP